MNSKKIKICVPIVNRTNYSKIKPILTYVKNNCDYVDLDIVASSAMMLDKYGQAYQDLINDGFKVNHKIDCVLMNDSTEAMAKSAGLSLIEHANYFAFSKPDLILVVGDRFDMVSPTLAASMMNIPIAHIQGGEVSGTIDNKIRNTISGLASLHFVATEESKKRLIKMNISEKNVFNVGCPAIEYMHSLPIDKNFGFEKLIKKTFKKKIDISQNEKYFIVMIHPDTTNPDDIDAEVVLKSIEQFNIKSLVFYPNIDANNSKIVSSLAKFNKNPLFYFIRHMPIEDFVSILAHATLIIGNSSTIIREAASFGVPAINIGQRQLGRERNSNTVDISCNSAELSKAISLSLNKKVSTRNIYYKKNSAKNIINIILKTLRSK